MKDARDRLATSATERLSVSPKRAAGWRSVASPAPQELHPENEFEKRRDERIATRFVARTSTIDPVADPVTGERVFQTSDEDATLNVSRRGLCLVASSAPEVGTRVLVELRLPEDTRPIELIGRARWTRVEYEPGVAGGRPTCRVGIEVLGGSPSALERFEASVREMDGDA